MRILRPDLLHELSKSPLHTLEVIDLRRYGIFKLGGFAECPNLHTILLSENSISSLQGIEDATAVWNLDLSKNAIVDVESLSKLPALGWLNLSNNNLTYEQVAKLVNTSIVDVTLEHNESLHDGYSQLEYRRNLVYLLPKAWCIDHCFVTSEERKKAIDYFEDGEGKGSDVAKLASDSVRKGKSCIQLGSGMFHIGTIPDRVKGIVTDVVDMVNSPTKNVTLNGSNDANINDMGGSILKEPTPSKFLKLLALEPHHPTIVQTFRLKHLKRLHNAEFERLHIYFSKAAPRPGLRIVDFGRIESTMFKNLQKRQLLDLTVMLTVSVFYNIPQEIFLDSLTMMLKTEVDMSIIESISSLSRYGKTILSIETKEILKSYIDAKHPMYILNFIEKELYNAIPEFAATLNIQRHTSMDDDEAERIGQEHLARHSVILFSRSPVFPPLVRGRDKKIPAHEKHLYDVLHPLLKLAGMTNEDLETQVDENQWIRRKDNPSRRYNRPWKGDGAEASQESVGPLESTPVNQNDELLESGIFGNDDSGDEDLSYLPGTFDSEANMRASLPTQPLSRGTNAFADAFSEDTGYAGQFSALYYKGIRIPRIHERVEIATPLLGRIYPRIIEVLDSGNIVKLEPFPGATRNLQWLMHRDIFWNPKGYWRHASGVAQIELDNNAKRLGKATQLHRVNKGLTKSGIISSAGVANKQLPEVLARMVLENSAIPSNTPKPLQLFANNQTWDPNFVVAPPSLITAQNMYAQARGVSGSWDPIKSIPYIVKDSRDATNKGYVETAKDLRPIESSVFKNLEDQLRHNEKIKMENLKLLSDESGMNNGDYDDNENIASQVDTNKGETSSFFMTDIPQTNADVINISDQMNEEEKMNMSRPLTREISEDLINIQERQARVEPSRSSKERPEDSALQGPIEMPRNGSQKAKKRKKKKKGTHSWYAVPNKTSIMVEQRLIPSATHGPYFNPKQNRTSISSGKKFFSDREKELLRLKKRLSNRSWATKKFADRELSNRVKPIENFYENPPIKFQPVENSMPKPLLPQPGLSAGLRSKAEKMKKNLMKHYIVAPNSLGQISSKPKGPLALLINKDDMSASNRGGSRDSLSFSLGGLQNDGIGFGRKKVQKKLGGKSAPMLSELAPASVIERSKKKSKRGLRKIKKMSRLAKRQMERKSLSMSEL